MFFLLINKTNHQVVYQFDSVPVPRQSTYESLSFLWPVMDFHGSLLFGLLYGLSVWSNIRNVVVVAGD